MFLIALAAFFATFLGGLFAIRFRDHLHLITGFSAGAVIGVAFFDLLPEALELGADFYDISTITALSALGFVIFMILDRLIFFHGHTHHFHDSKHEEIQPQRGWLGAGSLALHSFLDGLAIGLSFQISTAIGIVVTAAVLTHDFSDGINTVNLIIKNGGSRLTALKWLAVDALTPVLGIFTALFFTVSSGALGLILALFTGFFIYLGASDLLPESHHRHPTIYTTLATILGIIVMFIVINLVHV